MISRKKKHVFVWIYILKSKIINEKKIQKALQSRGYRNRIGEENMSLFNNSGDVLILLLNSGMVRVHCIIMIYNFHV